MTLAMSWTGCQTTSDRSRLRPSGLRSARSTSASAFTSAANPRANDHRHQHPPRRLLPGAGPSGRATRVVGRGRVGGRGSAGAPTREAVAPPPPEPKMSAAAGRPQSSEELAEGE